MWHLTRFKYFIDFISLLIYLMYTLCPSLLLSAALVNLQVVYFLFDFCYTLTHSHYHSTLHSYKLRKGTILPLYCFQIDLQIPIKLDFYVKRCKFSHCWNLILVLFQLSVETVQKFNYVFVLRLVLYRGIQCTVFSCYHVWTLNQSCDCGWNTVSIYHWHALIGLK